jgi:hypothetical protein
VSQGDDAEDDGELGEAGKLVPVVADQEQGGQADQGGRRGHQNEDRPRPPPLGQLARTFIYVGDALGLLLGDDGVPPPEAQLVQQPGSLLRGYGSLRHVGARTRSGD